MGNSNFDIKELEAFAAKLKGMQSNPEKLPKQILYDMGSRVHRTATRLTLPGEYPTVVHFFTKDGKEVKFNVKKKQGGTLKKSYVRSRLMGSDGNHTVTVKNTAPYARWVEEGHAVRNRKGELKGRVPGKFMLTRATMLVGEEAENIIKKNTAQYFRRRLK